MKSVATILCLLCSQAAFAATVSLYVDSSPNPAGASFAAWQSYAISTAPSGLVDMQNGAYPNTLTFAPTDAILDGAGGRMLAWVFWIPNETTGSLVDRLQVRTIEDFVGSSGATDWVAIGLNDVPGGVVGIFGDAFRTDPKLYPTVASLSQAMYDNQTYWRGEVRVRDDVNGPWQTAGLTVTLVPLPMAAPAGLVLMGVMVLARRLRRRPN